MDRNKTLATSKTILIYVNWSRCQKFRNTTIPNLYNFYMIIFCFETQYRPQLIVTRKATNTQ